MGAARFPGVRQGELRGHSRGRLVVAPPQGRQDRVDDGGGAERVLGRGGPAAPDAPGRHGGQGEYGKTRILTDTAGG
ncbi:unnamed protein product [Urochloa humidicola]